MGRAIISNIRPDFSRINGITTGSIIMIFLTISLFNLGCIPRKYTYEYKTNDIERVDNNYNYIIPIKGGIATIHLMSHYSELFAQLHISVNLDDTITVFSNNIKLTYMERLYSPAWIIINEKRIEDIPEMIPISDTSDLTYVYFVGKDHLLSDAIFNIDFGEIESTASKRKIHLGPFEFIATEEEK